MQLLLVSWMCWISVSIVVNALLHWKKHLPYLIQDALSYGKLKLDAPAVQPLLNVPKKWFTHFYAWGLIWNGTILFHFVLQCFSTSIHMHSADHHSILVRCLDWLLTTLLIDTSAHNEQPLALGLCDSATVDGDGHWPMPTLCQTEAMLTLALVCLQVARRLYESLFVTVYTESQMHVLHYVLGLYFYSALGPTVLLLALTPLCKESGVAGLRWYHLAGMGLFLWASWHQHKCHRILADLRKVKMKTTMSSSQSPQVCHGSSNDVDDGAATTSQRGREERKVVGRGHAYCYQVPCGDWFELVSSPHYLAEVLVYLSMFVVMGGRHASWLLVVSFVTAILVTSARQTHEWYLQNFKDYPKRWIMFPWVY